MLQIVKVPEMVLTAPAKPVEKINKKVLDLVEEMKKTLLATKNPKGVGLAAPQVGKSLGIFIAKAWPKSPISAFINPRISWFSEQKTEGVPQRKNKYEGCLSIPGIWGMVHRSQTLRLSYQAIDGKKHNRTFKAFLATIIQHEMDHINGILFTQRVLEQKEKLYKLVKGKDGKELFKEIEV